MANPWAKKNPLLSMMLSGANTWAGAARGIMTGQAKRQGAVTARQAAKGAADLWTAALTGTAAKKRTRKKSRS